MPTDSTVHPPEQLLSSLFAARISKKVPSLSSKEVDVARDWLAAVLQEYTNLRDHLGYLSWLSGGIFFLPSRWEGVHHWPEGMRTTQLNRFPFAVQLDDEFILIFTKNGVGSCSDDEVFRLLLNPIGLVDLFDILDESDLPAWNSNMSIPGNQHSVENQASVSMPPPPVTSLERRLWLTGTVAIAASLLLSLYLQFSNTRNIEHRVARLESNSIQSGSEQEGMLALHAGRGWASSLKDVKSVFDVDETDEWKLAQIMSAGSIRLKRYIASLEERGLEPSTIIAVLKFASKRQGEDEKAVASLIDWNPKFATKVKLLRGSGLSDEEIRAILLASHEDSSDDN